MVDRDLRRVDWYIGNSQAQLHEVGELPANAFGLHDVHGNVLEWTRDAWADYYMFGPQSDDGLRREPSGDISLVIRGGSFKDGARRARSAYRHFGPSGDRDYDLGFRPAKIIP